MRRSISKILLIISYIIFSIEYKLFTFAETVNVISNDINILRGKGKSYLLAKNFRKASQYYSAILQIIEKDKHNTISDSLRRRCALTLAECEIQTGNWHQAIARCSEVIDEYSSLFSPGTDPEMDDSSLKDVKDIRDAIAKAFYRRAVSLLNLNKTVLAYLDLNISMKYSTDNKLALTKLSKLEKVLDIQDNKLHFDNTEEELRDLIDECQLNHPRISFTNNEINKLTSQEEKRMKKYSVGNSNHLENEMNPFDSMSSLFDGLGNAGGGLGLGGGLSTIPLLLTTFGGMDPKIAKQIGDIIEATSKAFKKFQSGYKLIIKNQKAILIVLTLVWIVVSIFSPVFKINK